MSDVQRFKPSFGKATLTGMEQSEMGEYVKYMDFVETVQQARRFQTILRFVVGTPLYHPEVDMPGKSLSELFPTMHGLTWGQIIDEGKFPEFLIGSNNA